MFSRGSKGNIGKKWVVNDLYQVKKRKKTLLLVTTIFLVKLDQLEITLGTSSKKHS